MERIYVAVRARPLSQEEAKNSPWRISGNSIHIVNQPTKFEFDRIFGEDCKTADVYGARTMDIVASAVQGFNGTVFAYGQTNSGKTYTMRGSVAEPGIIPLAVHDLFRIIQENINREFLVRMSYMEIYNEEINDLLVPEHRKLQIHESLERGIYVAGLREEIVTCPEQVLDFMEFGESHRHIGETNMNIYSSRSHTIFRMIVESREKVSADDMGDSCDAVRVSVLNLVDLAGSERAAKTGAEGMRLKEGSHINKSLMTLGTVIKKLSEGVESQGSHVPYRDSKLTRILQPALGGNANSAIICNITLSQVHTDETKSSLQFASRALQITNCACVNEILTDAALLKRQRKEIEELRAKLVSSHTEHWEKEILNLRNTLLQSELEKERIALELEEEKKAKAHRERRLLEQAKKIENLSSMVLNSERDEKAGMHKKNNRRVTWCPGLSSQPFGNEVLTMNEVATMGDYTGHEQDMGSLVPFMELMQENEAVMVGLHNKACSLDSSENNEIKDACLPDAHALLHVTSRRKLNVKGTAQSLGSAQFIEKQSEYIDRTLQHDDQAFVSVLYLFILLQPFLYLHKATGFVQKTAEDIGHKTSRKLIESKNAPGCNILAINQTCGAESHGIRSLTTSESEAILVIKHLQDQSLELEKVSIQANLDEVLELATQQQNSFSKKYEEPHQEALKANEEARISHEQLSKVGFIDAPKEGLILDGSFFNISEEINAIVLQVNQLRQSADSTLSFAEELFHSFSILSETLLEIKPFVYEDMVQFRSNLKVYGVLINSVGENYDKVQLEKSSLYNQLVNSQNDIQELKSNLESHEKTMAELNLQHELEKDTILGQLLNLQKEMSSLSSSHLMREKESLRKELDKTKLKLRETESKLKNSIQDKIKLESEKAQAEREIKHLHSQTVLLERDIRKRDPLNDKRHESKLVDLSMPKELTGIVEKTFREDYKKLEAITFGLEAEIASLQEALFSAAREKDEALAMNELLSLEIEDFKNKMDTAESELKFLEEEAVFLREKLAASESLAQSLQVSLSSLSKETNDMAMELTDALLELEAKKSMSSAKTNASIEANERVDISNSEIFKLSKELLEVRNGLVAYKEECRVLKEKLIISGGTDESNKNWSMLNPFEAKQSRDRDKEKSECHATEEVHKLEEHLRILSIERDELSFQLKEMQASLFDNAQLLCVKTEREELALRISSMETKMHNDGLNYNNEKTKFRMRLRSMQSKLDAFGGRYEEVVNEMGLMDRKFQEASSKLKKQLAAYGVEILSLKKQIGCKE